MYFVPTKKAFFLNRCRRSFDAILYYYQSGGILTRPPSVPMNIFEKEVKFFRLGDDILGKLRHDEGFLVDDTMMTNGDGTVGPQGSKTLQTKMWELLEYPNASNGARCVSVWSIFVIGVSITIFCMETLPVFKKGGKRMSASYLCQNNPE